MRGDDAFDGVCGDCYFVEVLLEGTHCADFVSYAVDGKGVGGAGGKRFAGFHSQFEGGVGEAGGVLDVFSFAPVGGEE